MDHKLDSYAEIISDVVNEYAKYKPSYGEIELQAICNRNCFLLLSFGWNGDRRVHTTMLHLRIAGGKIWIERDETEEGVTQDLLDRGIDKADIVLGFYHPEHRKLTDFAIA
ncbi:XisI protein [Roseofilum capinflatum]|uniref:XisI protein n=1 Tax=Roseofilum capinflatum BLCC-M114 TaxID=3022440 RepID=A0ABT7B060_9CYAN|nr:XisI protein [Roseofilum capinflatum]MDJ1172559.1 XisI protein [Roseofilum capinflatum BLCC-M114]